MQHIFEKNTRNIYTIYRRLHQAKNQLLFGVLAACIKTYCGVGWDILWVIGIYIYVVCV